jgi:glycosyltransferase involved in cell wall biosynthesis
VAPSLAIIGGQSIAATRLHARLARSPELAVEYLAINPSAPGPLRRPQRIKHIRTLITSLVYWVTLMRRVPELDVVHVFSPSYWAFLLGPVPAMLAGRFFGKAVILNYHSGEARDHLQRFGWHVLPLLRLADRIVVPSEYLVEVFAEFGLHAEAIHNFVDVEQIPFRRRDAVRPALLSNRNLEAHYNVGAVLDAFQRVQAAVPSATLVVAGDGAERDALRERAATLGLRSVSFMGPVPPDDMPALYDAADIFVNASLIDNMPLSILEAYAAGLPVVTSDAGGIPKIASHEQTALLVPDADPRAMAAAIQRLLTDPCLGQRLTAAGRELVMSTFSWGAVGPAWIRLYLRLAGSHR